MNNKLEVIGIDHGWSMMKTVTQVFVTGVKEITTTPALFGDVLEYDGKYYKIGTVRQEVKDTKVEDDSFYLLTLAAVAKELKKRGLSDAKVFLAVGLPLTRFGAERCCRIGNGMDVERRLIIMRRIAGAVGTAVLQILKWMLKIVLGALKLFLGLVRLVLLLFCLVARVFLSFVRMGTF